MEGSARRMLSFFTFFSGFGMKYITSTGVQPVDDLPKKIKDGRKKIEKPNSEFKMPEYLQPIAFCADAINFLNDEVNSVRSRAMFLLSFLALGDAIGIWGAYSQNYEHWFRLRNYLETQENLIIVLAVHLLDMCMMGTLVFLMWNVYNVNVLALRFWIVMYGLVSALTASIYLYWGSGSDSKATCIDMSYLYAGSVLRFTLIMFLFRYTKFAEKNGKCIQALLRCAVTMDGKMKIGGIYIEFGKKKNNEQEDDLNPEYFYYRENDEDLEMEEEEEEEKVKEDEKKVKEEENFKDEEPLNIV